MGCVTIPWKTLEAGSYPSIHPMTSPSQKGSGEGRARTEHFFGLTDYSLRGGDVRVMEMTSLIYLSPIMGGGVVVERKGGGAGVAERG